MKYSKTEIALIFKHLMAVHSPINETGIHHETRSAVEHYLSEMELILDVTAKIHKTPENVVASIAKGWPTWCEHCVGDLPKFLPHSMRMTGGWFHKMMHDCTGSAVYELIQGILEN